MIHSPPCFQFQWKRVVVGLLLQPQSKGPKTPKFLTFAMLQGTYKVSVHG